MLQTLKVIPMKTSHVLSNGSIWKKYSQPPAQMTLEGKSSTRGMTPRTFAYKFASLLGSKLHTILEFQLPENGACVRVAFSDHLLKYGAAGVNPRFSPKKVLFLPSLG